MTSGKPRLPANRDRMRDLMRDVMIRNTRSLVDVHLPPAHATTLRLEPVAEEAGLLSGTDAASQQEHRQGSTAAASGVYVICSPPRVHMLPLLRPPSSAYGGRTA